MINTISKHPIWGWVYVPENDRYIPRDNSIISMMDGKIDARRSILESWLHPETIAYLLRTSVAANTLLTPFDERAFIEMITRYQPQPISQIGYAYEAPWFSRSGSYYTPPWVDLSAWQNAVDQSIPWVYGVIRHPNNSLTLLMFVRGQVIETIASSKWSSTRVDPKNENLNAIFSQYRRLTQLLLTNNRPDPKMLAMVGILPGIAIKRTSKLEGFPDIVEMQVEKNLNSWRFICAAVDRFLSSQHMKQEQVIILGSGGTLGQAVSKYYPQAVLIDIHNQDVLPIHGKYIIIDCTTGWSMGSYLPRLSKNVEWTWINEAYPPPDKWIAQQAKNKGIDVYHITGVAWETIPPFPDGYGMTPPCCMGLVDQEADTVKIQSWS